jgi:serine/threonine-protein kinase
VNEVDPLVGRVLDGRYEIVRKLARGGMATVYLGTDLRLTRTVAVKIMHESLGGDAEFVARFDREARAAARLVHPGVVSVFDQGMDQGRPYIVMEYVEGRTLRQVVIREAPMPPARALDLLIPVVSAVAAAHEDGIVHRDLKPENVMVSVRNQTKVADFGLARAVTAHTTSSAGTVIGTVSYLAPELVTSGKGDTRADVYALAVMLYEMLTGSKPHTGENPIQVAYAHVHNQIPAPSQSAPEVPDYLDALVTTAASRNIDDRPLDAGALLRQLRQAREALANGKDADPALAAQFRGDRVDPDELTTEQVAVADMSHTAQIPVDFKAPAPGLLATRSEIAKGVPAPKKERKKRRRWPAAVLICVLIAGLLGFGGWYYLKGRFIETPPFVGLTQPKAEALAAQNGLQITFENAYSEDVPAGEVISTSPITGEPVERGGTVIASLSQGPERYAVPDVAGKATADAEKAIVDAHLQLGEVTQEYDDSVPVGAVISASVEAEKMVKPGTVVDLVVSKGPAPVEITSFVGKPYEDAKKHYTDAGLKVVKAEDQNDKKIAEGSVISQDPAEGTLHRGDTITFVVSKGPVMVEIPELRWKSVSDAEKALQKLGFKTKVVQPALALKLVRYTDPRAGTKAAEGSTVTIYAA